MVTFTLLMTAAMAVSTLISGTITMNDDAPITISARHASVSHNQFRLHDTQLPTPDSVFFVLAIGNDYRPGVEGRRADAIHVIAVNPELNKASIINFPRDTNVAIPGKGRNKINAANAYGGSALTAQTLEELMGISISYILEVDFAGFTGLVNDLGGLDVEVTQPMNDKNSGTNFSPGVVRMNGDQALAFSRDRYSFSNGDISRTSNQGVVLIAALREMGVERKSVTSKFEAASLIAKNASLTNLTLRDLFFLMEEASQVDADDVANITVPWSGSNTLAPSANDLFADFKDNAVIDTYR